MSQQEILQKLLADLAEQAALLERTYAEGRGEWRNKLLVQLDLLMRAAGSAGAKLAEASDAPPAVREAGAKLAEAQAALQRQTVQAGRHLRAMAEGWACSRCGAAVPRVAKLPAAAVKGAPVLECRACGADTPVTEAGAKAFEAHFGHLARRPDWNPETNGFERR
ncbi:MAG: hypothetical protein H6730_13250 [Deltaproteobacteria bacterium]|nr:hypothetical protein [Deltaproteobacteria bacterium]